VSPPRQPLVLPPNFRDVTAEKVGTVVVIVGVSAAGTRPEAKDDRRIGRPRIAPGRGWVRCPGERAIPPGGVSGAHVAAVNKGGLP
jgi:hypothetical protein